MGLTMLGSTTLYRLDSTFEESGAGALFSLFVHSGCEFDCYTRSLLSPWRIMPALGGLWIEGFQERNAWLATSVGF